jgi:hypothetical protein
VVYLLSSKWSFGSRKKKWSFGIGKR